jgi:hypothetical protein
MHQLTTPGGARRYLYAVEAFVAVLATVADAAQTFTPNAQGRARRLHDEVRRYLAAVEDAFRRGRPEMTRESGVLDTPVREVVR